MPPPVRDLTGLMLGDYRVGALLGVGGMGAVYEGVHPLIGKRVAVKVLLPQLSEDKELVNRLLAEARAVNEIRHRNIVDIFQFGQLPDGSHYFLMEYLEGEAFDSIVRHGPLPVHEALYWCEEVLEALGAAHDFGIIHRDVKPSNVFMVQPRSGRRYIKLLDFGIAKLTTGRSGTSTQASVVIGTPVYMSPEQARGRTIGPTTDLYALGCMLVELVTGRVIFPAENMNQVMFMHAEDPPPLAKSLNPGVPDALDELLQQLLRKDPLQRPQTAEAVRMMCELVRRQVNGDTAFTQVKGPVTGEGLRASARHALQSPAEAMDAALRRNRATPSPTLPAPPPIDENALAPTLVSSGNAPKPISVAAPVSAPAVAPKSKLPLVALGGVLVAAVLAGWQLFGRGQSVTPELVAPPPVTVAPVMPLPPPVPAVPAPPPAPAPPSVEPEARGRLITTELIQKRIEQLERRLHRKEKQTGDVDGVLRQFIVQLHADAKAANTDAKRRAVWRNLDDLRAQLDGR